MIYSKIYGDYHSSASLPYTDVISSSILFVPLYYSTEKHEAFVTVRVTVQDILVHL